MKSESIHQSETTVRRTVKVNAPQSHAFAIFTEQFGAWWPLQRYHIGAQPPQTAIMEPHVGGRWFERASDGSECDWGRVLIWEPPNRIVLSWDINAEWKYEPGLGTEVEIRFVAESPDSTRVELEHTRLDRYGENAEKMRAIFESEDGWVGLLQHFTKHC